MDFLSENFNPELVLGSENEAEVKLPCENVQPLNNLAEYVNRSSAAKSRNISHVDDDHQAACSQSNEKCQRKGPSFTTGPMGIVPVFRPRRRLKTVLTMMESTTSGPLGRLRRCMDEKTRVKVWTRSSHRMRGVCSGFVLAFDRHWNLVLSDADDTYLLPDVPVTKGDDGAQKKGLGGSEEGGSTSSELQLRERHIDQVFIRGENVAFVSIS